MSAENVTATNIAVTLHKMIYLFLKFKVMFNKESRFRSVDAGRKKMANMLK